MEFVQHVAGAVFSVGGGLLVYAGFRDGFCDGGCFESVFGAGLFILGVALLIF